MLWICISREKSFDWVMQSIEARTTYMRKILIFLLILTSISGIACRNENYEKQEVFPVAVSRLEQYVEEESNYWKSVELAYQNEYRQTIQVSHDSNVQCIVSLQSSDKKELSNMSIVFCSKDSNMNSEEIKQYKDEQKKIDDIIRLLYEPDENSKLFTLWHDFCSYWESPVECEGNRIQWNGEWTNHDLQVKISRSSDHMLWMLESINISTAEFKKNYEQEMKEIISGYSNYKVYNSIKEMQDDLLSNSESVYGVINAKLGNMNYRNKLPYSDYLNSYPNFLASQQGYACGILYDNDNSLNVWCAPGIEQTEDEKEFQFCYMPGEIPVIYLIY